MKAENLIIGPYKVLELLGLGGMGIVYRARHQETGDVVALKTIRLVDEIQLESIRREIRALARISHPGIVRIVAEGVQDGLPWYAMDFVEGVTLRQYFSQHDTQSKQQQKVLEKEITSKDNWWTSNLWQRRHADRAAPFAGLEQFVADQIDNVKKQTKQSVSGRMQGELAHIFPLIWKLCSPLAFLHGEGIIHGDLKPENIMIKEDGALVLVDFGLMNWFTGEEGRDILTVQQGDAGTVSYMAPEQFRGEFVDARTDLYALGCIFYELLVGRPPSLDMDPGQIILGHMQGTTDPPVPPSQFRSDIDPEIDNLLGGLLAKEPRERVGHADVVATTLSPFCQEECRDKGPKPKAYLYRSRCVGRELPLSKLREYGQRLKNGEGGIVYIGGESGVGKTRLVMEFGRELSRENVTVITGECTDRAGHSLEAFQKPLRAIANRCRERGIPETERLLGRKGKLLALYESSLKDLPGQDRYLEPVTLEPDEARIRLFSYLTATLKALAIDGPILFIIDDLHWADELTLGYFEFVLRTSHLAKSAILAIGTYRSEEVGERLQNLLNTVGLHSFNLSRLDEEAVSMMVGDMLAIDPAPPLLCKYLSSHSEGIPYFVAEYLRTAVDEGLLERDDRGKWKIAVASTDGLENEKLYDALTLPLSLKGLLGRRQSGLSEKATSMINIAAVIGREAKLLLLWEISGFDDVELTDTIEELIHHQIFEQIGSGRVRFVHDKIREVSLSRLGRKEEKALHRLVAEGTETLFALNREEYLAELGLHWEMAGERVKAQSCYLAAARRDRDRFNYHEAYKLYKAYMNLVKKETEESLHGRAEYGNILEGIGRYDAALAEYTRVHTHSDENRLRASCLRRKALILGMQANIQEARKAYEESLKCSEVYPLEHVRTLNDMAYFESHLQGNLDEAECLCKKALDLILAQYSPPEDMLEPLSGASDQSDQWIETQTILAQTLRRFGLVCWLRGDFDRALEFYQRALAISKEINDQRGIGSTACNIGIVHELRGEHEQALEHLKIYLAISQEIGFKQSIGNASGNIGLVYCDCGDFTQSLEYLQKSLNIFEEIGDRQNFGIALSNMGLVYGGLGDLDTALHYYERSLAISEEMGSKRGVGSSSCNIGLLYLHRGDLERSLQFLQKSRDVFIEIGDKTSEAETLMELTDIYRLMGNPKKAIRGSKEVMDMFAESKNDLRTADCWYLRAEAEIDGADFSAARDSLVQAEELYKEKRSGEYSWRVPLAKGRLAIAELKADPVNRRSRKAKEAIAQARSLVDEAQKTQRMYFKIWANLLMGKAFRIQSSSELAEIFYEQALYLAQKHGYGLLEQHIHQEIGDV